MQPRIEVVGFSSLSFFIQPSLQEDRFHPNRMQRMSPMTTTQAAMLACSSCSRSTAQSIFEYIFQQKLTFDHAMKHHQECIFHAIDSMHTSHPQIWHLLGELVCVYFNWLFDHVADQQKCARRPALGTALKGKSCLDIRLLFQNRAQFSTLRSI
jgi:hypothetical protein